MTAFLNVIFAKAESPARRVNSVVASEEHDRDQVVVLFHDPKERVVLLKSREPLGSIYRRKSIGRSCRKLPC